MNRKEQVQHYITYVTIASRFPSHVKISVVLTQNIDMCIYVYTRVPLSFSLLSQEISVLVSVFPFSVSVSVSLSCSRRSRAAGTRFVIRPFVCVDSSGIDNNPTVFYHLMPGSTAQTNKFHTFYLQQRGEQSTTWADIKVNHPLDYESIKEYNLTIRVEV